MVVDMSFFWGLGKTGLKRANKVEGCVLCVGSNDVGKGWRRWLRRAESNWPDDLMSCSGQASGHRELHGLDGNPQALPEVPC